MKGKAVALFAAVALIAAGCGGASPETAGPSEGIQVHGDWTIDVYDEDGMLDQHVEFSNALLTSGGQWLASVVTGGLTAGTWGIIARDQNNDPGAPCGDGASVCQNSNVDVSVAGGAFTLSAAFDATRAGVVEVVETQTWSCPSDSAPAACDENAAIANLFTGTTLPETIAIEAGQTFDVQVEISFTTG